MPVLNWIGKEAVLNHHNEVPFRLLNCDSGISVGEPDGNLLIEGDNLEALKALLPYYRARVKCIYIDPPYNTGNENWVYNDNVNSPQIRVWLGRVVGGEGEDLSRHDKWLCMMYPRLRLLWELLSDEGAIFISIDDDEAHYLKVVLDEAFQRVNFVASIIWQKKFSPQSDARYFSDMHDYLLVFAKNKNLWQRNLMTRTSAHGERYANPDNDVRGPWSSSDLTVRTYSAEYDYAITTPSGRVVNPTKGRSWSMPKERFEELVRDNRIWFGQKGDGVPRVKRFLSEVQQGIVPVTIWFHEDVGHNQEATQELKRILQRAGLTFSSPKPARLIQRIVEIATNPGDIVLDSFAGSGTTGHAVLQLNKEDGGNRKFILVEMEHDIARKITAERLRRVIEGYTWTDQRGNEHHQEGVGGGFRYCTLGAAIFISDGSISMAVTWEDLARHIWFTETRNPWPGLGGDEPRPYVGDFNGVGYYLYFNGRGGNIFGLAQLAALPADGAPRVVYADATALGDAELRERQVTFKQIPYEVKVH